MSLFFYYIVWEFLSEIVEYQELLILLYQSFSLSLIFFRDKNGK